MEEVVIQAKRDLAVSRMAVVCGMSLSSVSVLTREMSWEEIVEVTTRVKNGVAKVVNMKIEDC